MSDTNLVPRPTFESAADLVTVAVHRDLCARVLRLTLVPNPHFNNDGYDIAWEGVVAWRQDPEGAPPESAEGTTFGTHRVAIRKTGTLAPQAVLHQGHYGLETAEVALRSIPERMPKAYPRSRTTLLGS